MTDGSGSLGRDNGRMGQRRGNVVRVMLGDVGDDEDEVKDQGARSEERKRKAHNLLEMEDRGDTTSRDSV